MKQTEVLTRVTYVNGWEPAVYVSCMVKISACFKHLINPVETFNFSAHVSGVSSSIDWGWSHLGTRPDSSDGVLMERTAPQGSVRWTSREIGGDESNRQGSYITRHRMHGRRCVP